jgi:hypothetical protein
VPATDLSYTHQSGLSEYLTEPAASIAPRWMPACPDNPLEDIAAKTPFATLRENDASVHVLVQALLENPATKIVCLINAYSARRWRLSPPHEPRQKKPLESRRLGFATSLKSPEKTVGYLI